MRRKFAGILVMGALGALTFGAPTASAAHCVSPEGDSPGFSYFGNDHVQETDHNGGEPGQPEGGNAHMGNPGASSCRDQSDPSTRAPGRK